MDGAEYIECWICCSTNGCAMEREAGRKMYLLSALQNRALSAAVENQTDMLTIDWMCLHNARVPVFISVPPTYTASVHWNMTWRQKAGWYTIQIYLQHICAMGQIRHRIEESERNLFHMETPEYRYLSLHLAVRRESMNQMLYRIGQRRPPWRSGRSVTSHNWTSFATAFIDSRSDSYMLRISVETCLRKWWKTSFGKS